MRSIARYVFLVVTIFAIFPSNAHAYLDLGSGSFITQLVLAFILGCLYKARIFRRKFLEFFKRTPNRDR